MPSSKFTAAVPQTVTAGDKVRIRGLVGNGAEQFSVNFVNERCANPQNITYHFKWIIAAQVIVENNKQNGHWMEHLEKDYNSLDGPDFALEFAFQYDGIYVYVVYEDGRNYITRYEPSHELSDIKAIQIWGDVDKITELTFSYQ